MICTITHGQTDISSYVQGYYLLDKTAHSESPITKGSISNLSYSNPAGVMDIQHLSFGINFQNRSEIQVENRDANDYTFPEERKFIPKSVGFQYNRHRFNFSLSYDQRYNFAIKSPPIFISTAEEPEGTGEYVESGQHSYIDRYSLIIGKELTLNRFKTTLNYGLQFSYDDVYRYNYLWNNDWVSQSNVVSGAIGLIAIVNEIFRIGWSYTQGYKHTYSSKFDIDGNELELEYIAIIPSQSRLGFSTSILNNFDFSLDWKRTDWAHDRLTWEVTDNYSGAIRYTYHSRIHFITGLQTNNYPSSRSQTLLLGWQITEDPTLYPFFGISIGVMNKLSMGLDYTTNLRANNLTVDRDIFSLTIVYKP